MLITNVTDVTVGSGAFPSHLTHDVSKELDAALNKIYHHTPHVFPQPTEFQKNGVILFSFNTESSLKIFVRTYFLQS